jgi:Reverse transcriptase (RNA-dependent DNA polymerase)
LDRQKCISATAYLRNHGQDQGRQFFTKFNVRWGYNNIRIKAKDKWKAAFKTNQGLFEPMVMFFGMCNSLATFQAMMDSIFSDMIEQQKVIVYMDNILIFAENQKELQNRTKLVHGNMIYF